jgi:metallo-beta-lactamase family protein
LSTTLQFLGAARTVTGSKHVLSHRGKVVMLDCGMFQGLKQWRKLNWEPFPLVMGYVDAIVLSHAHIDHSGYLPRLYRYGYDGQVYSTPSTHDLCQIMLPDSAHIHEEDARYANKQGFSKHSPALPLYTQEDAAGSLELFQTVPYGETHDINRNIQFEFRDAGHILGSALTRFTLTREDDSRFSVVYSGDIGRYHEHILRDPQPIDEADFLILETTYGDRLHNSGDTESLLADVINETASRGGMVIIPSFAVGRTQEVLYHIRELQEMQRIPPIPVYMDSPLAIKATRIFCDHLENYPARIYDPKEGDGCPVLCYNLHIASQVSESKAINKVDDAAILISASGMVEAGRILHHLKLRLPDPKNSVVFVGYQAEGTRGRRILEGEKRIKIHGDYYPVRARVEYIDTFSAHGDYEEIFKWLANFRRPPLMTFLVHGEESSMQSMADKVAQRLGWPTTMPEYLAKVELDQYLPPLQ